MTLGSKLKKLRNEKQLTQKDLAEHLHVTFQTVSKWENDENEPDIATLKQLAKLYDCSLDYLLDESDDEVIKEEKLEVVDPTPAPASQTIIIHQNALHVCSYCKKEIPEDELEIEEVCTRQRVRGIPATYKNVYYHKDCLSKVRAIRAQQKAKENLAKANKIKNRSFGWAIAASSVVLLATLLSLLLIPGMTSLVHPALSVLISILGAYVAFATIYCLLSGTFIADVFMDIASWSIRFPGLIFTFDLDGIMWLIGMKILFFVLGIAIGIGAFLLALAISSIISVFAFPFCLIHNTHTSYLNAID